VQSLCMYGEEVKDKGRIRDKNLISLLEELIHEVQSNSGNRYFYIYIFYF
jgi:hypothetical protein